MRISSALRLASAIVLGIASLPCAVQAHPGHDGHELTWDLGHLAAHPLATLGCFLIVAALAWTAGRLLRPRAASRAITRIDGR